MEDSHLDPTRCDDSDREFLTARSIHSLHGSDWDVVFRHQFDFIPLLPERCFDIRQPDIGACGGVSQMKKIATLGETYFVPLAPHCTSTVLGMTASLHVMASIPMFLIHEGGQGYKPGDVVRKSWTIDDSGYASLPEGPGIGVEIDEAKLEKLHSERNRKIGWPKPKLEDGSIADY